MAKASLFLALICSYGTLTAGKDTCSTADVDHIKSLFEHPVFFCTFYTARKRMTSPVNSLSKDSVYNACLCIKNSSPAAAKPSLVSLPSGKGFGPNGTCYGSDIGILQKEFKQPKPFCDFYSAWSYTNDPNTPIPSLNPARTYNACQCFLNGLITPPTPSSSSKPASKSPTSTCTKPSVPKPTSTTNPNTPRTSSKTAAAATTTSTLVPTTTTTTTTTTATTCPTAPAGLATYSPSGGTLWTKIFTSASSATGSTIDNLGAGTLASTTLGGATVAVSDAVTQCASFAGGYNSSNVAVDFNLFYTDAEGWSCRLIDMEYRPPQGDEFGGPVAGVECSYFYEGTYKD